MWAPPSQHWAIPEEDVYMNGPPNPPPTRLSAAKPVTCAEELSGLCRHLRTRLEETGCKPSEPLEILRRHHEGVTQFVEGLRVPQIQALPNPVKVHEVAVLGKVPGGHSRFLVH
eukprot:CAMPEP_0180575710 /NCGR_PEP_ID=MMETSP1037_2-20121125/11031_1 /TAXON_ID=632150 /ORGANISM="Azadinium spinosum, Strain 3D9" /LENGTH=113 /DNA_ID=CAMNT_0022593379 /DNA_START=72 /DNA_END=410 /DNA_ORIENTATION=-